MTLLEERDRLRALVEQMREAIEHVVADSPGTPESVKSYLTRALAVIPDRNEDARAGGAEGDSQ